MQEGLDFGPRLGEYYLKVPRNRGPGLSTAESGHLFYLCGSGGFTCVACRKELLRWVTAHPNPRGQSICIDGQSRSVGRQLCDFHRKRCNAPMDWGWGRVFLKNEFYHPRPESVNISCSVCTLYCSHALNRGRFSDIEAFLCSSASLNFKFNIFVPAHAQNFIALVEEIVGRWMSYHSYACLLHKSFQIHSQEKKLNMAPRLMLSFAVTAALTRFYEYEDGCFRWLAHLHWISSLMADSYEDNLISNSELTVYFLLQWEFQVGPCEGITMGDDLWMGRFLLHRYSVICFQLKLN